MMVSCFVASQGVVNEIEASRDWAVRQALVDTLLPQDR